MREEDASVSAGAVRVGWGRVSGVRHTGTTALRSIIETCEGKHGNPSIEALRGIARELALELLEMESLRAALKEALDGWEQSSAASWAEAPSFVKDKYAEVIRTEYARIAELRKLVEP